MHTVVIDTNILIDAWKDDFSYARKILDEVMDGNLRAVVTHKIWKEYRLILDRLVNDERHRELAEKFMISVEEVRPRTRVKIVKYDRDDNKFFDAAIAGEAEYIISNDSHLWEIGEHQGIKAVKAEDFWAEYRSKNGSGGEEWQSWMKGVMGK
jgi:uncharacterized protein